MSYKMSRRHGARSVMLPLVTTLAFAGCDVVNPGQVLDDDLNSPAALRIMVDGLIGDVSVAQAAIHDVDPALGGDLTGTASFTNIVRYWHGETTEEDAGETDVIRRTINIAEETISRVETVLGSEAARSPLLAEAYLYAGFINRMAGDIFCEAVIAGGPAQPRSLYHQRAVERFTKAIEVATAANQEATRTAAYAGRAHSRMQLGDWTGAVDDAKKVPSTFVLNALFHTTGREVNQYWRNAVFSPGLNVRWTYFQWYADNFNDSRVKYTRHSADAADGSGPFYLVGKYGANNGADVALTKGWEMRLIEAENEIVKTGNWQAGLAMVNAVRAAFSQPPWTATNQAEALEALKKERAITMWVEMRRAGDLWRWGNTAANDPIIRHMYVTTPPPSQYVGGGGGLPIAQAQRAICIPLSTTMKSTNPNLS